MIKPFSKKKNEPDSKISEELYDNYLNTLLSKSKKERYEQIKRDELLLHQQRYNQEHKESEWVKQLRNKSHKNVLILSDIHAPYQHPDTLKFFAALKKKLNPDLVINLGDELDYHAMSFHTSDPDLDSPGKELLKGRMVLWELEKIFPEMYLCASNHGSMKYRKAKLNGTSKHMLVSYRQAIFAERDEEGDTYYPDNRGKNWYWSNKIEFKTINDQMVLCVHNKTQNLINNILRNQMHFIQGHYHSKSTIEYVSTPHNLLWGMQVGCMVDDTSLAFEYNKIDNLRPILSCGAIINGYPVIIPMLLEKGGRWCGKIVGI